MAEKGGERVARWRVRGKWRTAPYTPAWDRVRTEARTYTAQYRDHTGATVRRPTGCRDERAARQMLARWEREVEQVRAGTLDPKALVRDQTAGFASGGSSRHPK